jgi:hypothetical protein
MVPPMPELDGPRQRDLTVFANEVSTALGEACVGVVLYGSAAGVDWIAGRSDVNTIIVLQRASLDALDRLAPVIARWRQKGFALPVVLDREQVEHARGCSSRWSSTTSTASTACWSARTPSPI